MSGERQRLEAWTTSGMRNTRHVADLRWALDRLDRLEAENARLREALEGCYQSGRGPHVAIARAALDGGAA